jgi:hypothetical protein
MVRVGYDWKFVGNGNYDLPKFLFCVALMFFFCSNNLYLI